MLLPLLLLAVAGPPPTQALLAASFASKDLPAPGWPRTRLVSEAFLGVPYQHSPLGEGEGVDPDPRFRLDAVDCVTFVETVLALGNASSLDEARRFLDDIRYRDGSLPAFNHRDHVMEAQWIPDMIHKGYVSDVTRAVGGTVVRELPSTFTEASWEKRQGLKELAWQDAPHGTFTLPVLPMADALRMASEFPDGLVLSVVREPRAEVPTLVTHTGLVIVKDGKRYMRHAMLANQKVVDEPILEFLGRHAAMKTWKVVGLNLLRIEDDHRRLETRAASPSAP